MSWWSPDRAVTRASLAVLVGAAVAFAPVASGSLAQAATRVPPTWSLRVAKHPAARSVAASQGIVHAAVLTMSMQAAEVRDLRSLIFVDEPYGVRTGVTSAITCSHTGGSLVSKVWSGQNILAGQRNVFIPNRFAFQAPAAGSYSCALDVAASTEDLGGPQGRFYLRSTSVIGDAVGAVAVNAPRVVVRQTILTSPPLVVLAGRPAKLVASTRGYSLAGSYRTFDAFGSVYVTGCHNNSRDCAGYAGPYSRSVAYSQLYAVEVNAAGQACARHYSPTVATVVSAAVHHMKTTQDLVGLRHTSGCANRWMVGILVAAASGANSYALTWHGGPDTGLYMVPRT
jgi:hypothetical protein